MTRAERANDPDETEGRKLYRGRANALGRASIGIAIHRVRWLDELKKAAKAK